MFVADRGAVLDDVVERHGVSAADAVVLLQPLDNIAGLAGRPVAEGGRLVQQGSGGLAGLVLDGVEVGLKGHGVLLGVSAGGGPAHGCLGRTPAGRTRWCQSSGARMSA